ncbi:DUF72 domain-containing protein [Mucilaginibacter ginkgonis]|uniref:DUF72 domain-containing protein n=1 Tax=Mucilaginibacter ginkgonis TaxID=2682091 RepID=A0A6I4HVG6_9SPHI|nr:DUF72 domain-containing protein [Mucilaginibacter ginkgonis]QQL49911.1 DUF72 domain-containing protein [Mucilaginibacter ginkgonis]
MKFGATEEDLTNIDFTLPADGFTTEKVLTGTKAEKFNVWVGTPKWGAASWKGKIYPPKIKEGEFLDHYVSIYNAIEFNPTFYKIFTAKVISKWASKAKHQSGFKFCPKFPQAISHVRQLKNAETQTKEFYAGVEVFGDNLGPLFLQLSDNFSPKGVQYLKDYLTVQPKTHKVCVELRHKDWYVNKKVFEDIMHFLYDHQIGTVISDTAGRRDCMHMNLTTTDAFIRFVGNDLAPSDYTRMDDWVNRIKQWAEQGLENLYFFVHIDDEQLTPEASIYFIEKLNTTLGTNLQVPQMLQLF